MDDFRFDIVAEDAATGARAGLLQTPHGAVETPVFMPVGTRATVKTLNQQDLLELDAAIVLANAYHLYLRPGHELVERAGGRTSVPQIFIGATHVGGCDDLYALDRAGKLDPLLKDTADA